MSAKRERRETELGAAFPLAGRWLPGDLERSVLSWLPLANLCVVTRVQRACRQLVAVHLHRLQVLAMDRDPREPRQGALVLALALQYCRSLRYVRLPLDASVFPAAPGLVATLVQQNAATLEELDVLGRLCPSAQALATVVAALATCPRLGRLDSRALCDFQPGSRSEPPTGPGSLLWTDRSPGLSALEAALDSALGACTNLGHLTLPFLTKSGTVQMLGQLPRLTKLTQLAVPLRSTHCPLAKRPTLAYPSLCGLRSLRLELYDFSDRYARMLNTLGCELGQLPALDTLVLGLATSEEPRLLAPLTPWSLPRLRALTVSCDGAEALLPVLAAPGLEELRTQGLYQAALLCCLAARGTPGLTTVEIDERFGHHEMSAAVTGECIRAIGPGPCAALRCFRARLWMPTAVWHALADCPRLEELEGGLDDRAEARDCAPERVRGLLAGCPRLADLTMRARFPVTVATAEEAHKEDEKRALPSEPTTHRLERLVLQDILVERLTSIALPCLRGLALLFPGEAPPAQLCVLQGWLARMPALLIVSVLSREDRLEAELAGRPLDSSGTTTMTSSLLATADLTRVVDLLGPRVRRLGLTAASLPHAPLEAKAQNGPAALQSLPLLEYVCSSSRHLGRLEELEVRWALGNSLPPNAAVLRALSDPTRLPALRVVRLPQSCISRVEKRARDEAAFLERHRRWRDDCARRVEEHRRLVEERRLARRTELALYAELLEAAHSQERAKAGDCRALVQTTVGQLASFQEGEAKLQLEATLTEPQPPAPQWTLIGTVECDFEPDDVRRLLSELPSQLADRIRSGQLELWFGSIRVGQLPAA